MERELVTHNNRKADLLISLFVKKEYVVKIPCYYFSYIVATKI